jgi:hypothetical protein
MYNLYTDTELANMSDDYLKQEFDAIIENETVRRAVVAMQLHLEIRRRDEETLIEQAEQYKMYNAMMPPDKD